MSVRALPLLPLCIVPVLDLESAEREDRDIASAPESDVIVPVTGSDLAALAPALLIGSILKSVHAPSLAKMFTVESAPMIVGTRVSTAPAIPQSAPSTVLGLGSVPTAPEHLRSEAIDQNAMVRAPHRFWGNRRSDLTSVPCVKCFRALCQASRSLWTPLEIMQAIRRPLALPLVGPRRLERSGQRRVCPRHVRVERLAPALALLPVLKSVSVRSGRTALRVDQTAPLLIVANHLPEREGAAVPRL